MKNINILLWSIILALSLLNLDYASLTNLEIAKSHLLDIVIIIYCLLALIFSLIQRSNKKKTTD